MIVNIALCISGQLRSYQKCYPNLKKYLLDVWNPDVYVYASKDSVYYFPYAKKVVYEEYDKNHWDKIFNDIVQPINRDILQPYKNSLIMFYMIYKCQQLVDQSKTKYDIIIRLRPDMLLEEKIPGCVFHENNVLWYSSYAINQNYQLSDKFLIGKTSYMKTFSDIWKHIQNYWNVKYPLVDDIHLPVGERLVYQHMFKNKIPVSSFDMKCHILRDNTIRKYLNVYSGFSKSFIKNPNISNTIHRFYDKLPFNIKMIIPPQLNQFKHKPDYKYVDDGCDPSYIGVGFPKSGTSWWHQLILEHPDVSINRSGEKEITFFPHYLHNNLKEQDINMYRSLFTTDGICGEWSPGYIFHPFVLSHIHNCFPNMKLLVIMRNPVDSYISLVNHQMQVKKRMMHLNKKGGYVYDVFSLYPECVYTFLYGLHIKRLLSFFNRKQILFLQYEKCKQHPIEYIKKTYQFLDIDTGFIPNGITKSFNVRPYIVDKPKGNIRRRIIDFYRDDIQLLKTLVDSFDYSLWRDFE